MSPAEAKELLAYLTPEEQAEVDQLVAHDLETVAWRPLPGPQSLAYYSEADVIGFGGAAGGGKTDLACGKALTQHERIMILRREGTELTAIVDRLQELIGSRDGYNGQERIWRLDGVQVEFGSTPNTGDEKKYQGRPHDLLVFDEAANFLEHQVRFLMGWNRSTTPGQKCQTLMTFNPPTSAEGRWIVSFFAPWIDKRFAGKRAGPGEVRYVGVVPGANGVSRDIWVDGPEPFVIVNGEPVYDFDPLEYEPQEIVKPQSRTFIPSRISDNPYLMGTGYLTVLQSLPEPLRSQMLFGSFEAGMTDDPWQVIPTAWVEAAMLRWKERSPRGEMHSMGVDVARGGKDYTTIACRHGNWYDKLVKLPGSETPSGQAVVGQVIAHRRDSAPVHIDVIGVGASPYDLLRDAKVQVIGVNVAEKATATDRSGRLRFANLRTQLWWQMREQLDPENDTGIALPPDPELLADLCAPKWELRGMQVQVESREDIVKRIGRSPDKASALILAQLETPNRAKIDKGQRSHLQPSIDYDPLDGF
jgi:hypothetical protein